MNSSLVWIDFDSEAQQRSQRILALFKERDTRDELGLGPIRDAIADTLFPGTSTIHTRLRYMFFIPWVYQNIEQKNVSPDRVPIRARNDQVYLSKKLKENSAGDTGIIGVGVGKALKTLPASIYWSALGTWGIRIYPGTVSQYHQALDHIYRKRRIASRRRDTAFEEGDDIGGLWEHGAYTWHPGLPKPPEGFPDATNLKLTREEARFIQERLNHLHPKSLLAQLFANPVQLDTKAPWAHPDFAQFHSEHRLLLHHGQNFSLIARGAAILYNLLLAEIAGNGALVEEHSATAGDWAEQLDARLDEVIGWGSDLSEFWGLVMGRGHQISLSTRRFVELWVERLVSLRGQVFSDLSARGLVRHREIEKKKGNSRFTNPRVLDQWGGRSGLVPMRYRWNIVSSYVTDLAEALA